MPTPQARALSLQEQQALEAIAMQVSAQAESMYFQAQEQNVPEDQLMSMYMLLILGGMRATAQTRVAYLQAFAAANQKDAFTLPARILEPRPEDVLVPGVQPEGAIRHVNALSERWFNDMNQQRMEAEKRQQAKVDKAQAEIDRERAALDQRRRQVEEMDFGPESEQDVRRKAWLMAGNKLGQLAESTVTSTADYVTRSVLDPDKRVGALRRVVHPGACDRCTTVAGVLVYKMKPRLRHDQCRCSFEPVYTDDPQYLDRIFKAKMLTGAAPGGQYPGSDSPFARYSARAAREARSRGRRQLDAARAREDSEGLRQYWDEFLQQEEKRLDNMVKTLKSNTFRDTDILVAVKPGSGEKGFPLVTRM